MDQILSRLHDHLNEISRIDWDYFASQRYRQEARQAVSDLGRLERYVQKLELAANGEDEQPTTKRVLRERQER